MSEQWIKTLSNSETEQLIRVLSYLPMKKYNTFLEKPPTLKRQDKKYVQQLLEKLSSIVV